MKVNNKFLFTDREIKMMSLRPMKPRGITIHNTANTASAHNEAANVFNNNTKRGVNGVAVHYFIDEDTIYKNVPDNINGWHAGDGLWFGNMSTISIEICRSKDYSTDRYERAEKRAAEFTALLMERHNIPINMVKRHYDFATNKKRCPHRMFESKPNDWNKFLSMVKGEHKTTKPTEYNKTTNQLAKEVIRGDWGNGKARVDKLTKAGYNPVVVQAEVDRILGKSKPAGSAKPTKPTVSKPAKPTKTTAEIAAEVRLGRWGNGADRVSRLTKAGYNPVVVQAQVDKLMKAKKTKPTRLTNAQVAQEVWEGKWGNGADRVNRLTKAGYNYSAVQAEVQKIANKSKPKLKSTAVIAQEVRLGKWGNGAERRRRLTEAGYNPAVIQAEVNRTK